MLIKTGSHHTKRNLSHPPVVTEDFLQTYSAGLKTESHPNLKTISGGRETENQRDCLVCAYLKILPVLTEQE